MSLTIATAAHYLGISEPTVRAWVRRGVLERAPGDGPVRVDRDSARRVGRGLVELRARAHDRDWLAALVDYLHDESDRRSEPVRKGLDELAHGELEPAGLLAPRPTSRPPNHAYTATNVGQDRP